MAIASAVQRGANVYIYNKKNQTITIQPAGSGPKDGLKGYTKDFFSIRRGSSVYMYNEKGQQIGIIPA